jgi:hypothetical protein
VPSKFKIILCIQLAHHNTFETLETSQYKSIHSKYINIPIFPQLYSFPDNKLGQSIWDKMRRYREHVGEHIENLTTMLEIHWEHIENLKNSNNSRLQKIFTKTNIVVNTLKIEPFHSGLSFGLPNNTREGDFFHSKSQDS